MAVLSIPQLAQLWQGHGGHASSTVVACAVALAESGGRTDAISPSNDYGVWQINAVHFAGFGVTAAQALDPDTNARMAVAISGAGVNWGPWCTCWANPGRDCATGPLSGPQAGSAAAGRISMVVAALGVAGIVAGIGSGSSGVNVPTDGQQGAVTAWEQWRRHLNGGWLDQHRAVQSIIRAAQEL